jgi:hypothetical protein
MPKIVVFLLELFDEYAVQSWSSGGHHIFDWLDRILSQYSRSLPWDLSENFNDKESLLNRSRQLRSGIDLFCIIFHFYGPVVIYSTDRDQSLLINPKRIFFEPSTFWQMRANVCYSFDLLEILQIDVFWTVDEWVTFQDTKFMMLQLNRVYELCKTKQCVLPLADTKSAVAGITSNPSGLSIIVGLQFADVSLPYLKVNLENKFKAASSFESLFKSYLKFISYLY